jgi:hypothetical protein
VNINIDYCLGNLGVDVSIILKLNKIPWLHEVSYFFIWFSSNILPKHLSSLNGSEKTRQGKTLYVIQICRWLIRLWLLMFMSMGWEYVTELRPPTDLLLIPPDDMWVWIYGEMIFAGKTQELGEKPVPDPRGPPQIPHGLTGAQTRVFAVRGWRLSLSHDRAMVLVHELHWTVNKLDVWNIQFTWLLEISFIIIIIIIKL